MSLNDRAQEALDDLRAGKPVPNTPGVRDLLEAIFEDAADGTRFPYGIRQAAADIHNQDAPEWTPDDAFSVGGDVVEEDNWKGCAAQGPRGFWCTRPADHTGTHAAGNGIKYLEVWKDADA